MELLRYAVTRHFKDNPHDFQVLEYFATKEEAAQYIKWHPHHATDCQLKIAKWEWGTT